MHLFTCNTVPAVWVFLICVFRKHAVSVFYHSCSHQAAHIRCFSGHAPVFCYRKGRLYVCPVHACVSMQKCVAVDHVAPCHIGAGCKPRERQP